MSGRTPIQWTDVTWNPIRGCSRVSAGCQHCYAEAVAARFSGPGLAYQGLARRRSNGEPQWTGEVRVVEEHMLDPIRWRVPRRIFVNSMSDLFHEKVEIDTIARVWAVMALAPRHTYQILTKRPERMREVLLDPTIYDRVLSQADAIRADRRRDALGFELTSYAVSNPRDGSFYPHVWLGTSIESQEYIGRFDELRDTPAAVHFLSLEPLLSYVDLYDRFAGLGPAEAWWVIVGGESGPKARPFDVHAIAGIQRACNEFAVPLFVKQLGAKPGFRLEDEERRGNLVPSFHRFDEASGLYIKKLRDSHGGDMAEWPEEYRVREFPEVDVRRG